MAQNKGRPSKEGVSVEKNNNNQVEKDKASGKKRKRRTFSELTRRWVCPIESCGRPYASQHSLQQHLKIKHVGLISDGKLNVIEASANVAAVIKAVMKDEKRLSQAKKSENLYNAAVMYNGSTVNHDNSFLHNHNQRPRGGATNQNLFSLPIATYGGQQYLSNQYNGISHNLGVHNTTMRRAMSQNDMAGMVNQKQKRHQQHQQQNNLENIFIDGGSNQGSPINTPNLTTTELDINRPSQTQTDGNGSGWGSTASFFNQNSDLGMSLLTNSTQQQHQQPHNDIDASSLLRVNNTGLRSRSRSLGSSALNNIPAAFLVNNNNSGDSSNSSRFQQQNNDEYKQINELNQLKHIYKMQQLQQQQQLIDSLNEGATTSSSVGVVDNLKKELENGNVISVKEPISDLASFNIDLNFPKDTSTEVIGSFNESNSGKLMAGAESNSIRNVRLGGGVKLGPDNERDGIVLASREGGDGDVISSLINDMSADFLSLVMSDELPSDRASKIDNVDNNNGARLRSESIDVMKKMFQ